MRALLCLAIVLLTALPALAQDVPEVPLHPDPLTTTGPRAATGGATTLEDIMARQRGEKVDLSFRARETGDPDSAAGIAAQLGTRGGASDSEVFRALRYGEADVTVSSHGPAAGVLIQDGGM